MGAVRKLATVVILGLVALSTLMVVYLAAEPNRRTDETTEQEYVSVERGTQLYITYCLQCHGPSGLGSFGKEVDANGETRTGAILNQEGAGMTEEQLAQRTAQFQSDDPVQQGIAEDWLRFRIMYGIPSEQHAANFEGEVLMPSFRHDLNVEQINELVYLVMHGDWNYVYNTAVHQTGLSVCQATPEAYRTGECEGDMHEAAAFPTVPTRASTDAELAAAEASPSASPEASSGDAAPASGGSEIPITTVDSKFDQTELTAAPGDTIVLTNDGFLQHDFYIEGLEIGTDLANNGQTVTVTIPEDAAPGEYTFYCTVTGHRQLGMEGTITITAP